MFLFFLRKSSKIWNLIVSTRFVLFYLLILECFWSSIAFIQLFQIMRWEEPIQCATFLYALKVYQLKLVRLFSLVSARNCKSFRVLSLRILSCPVFEFHIFLLFSSSVFRYRQYWSFSTTCGHIIYINNFCDKSQTQK